LETAFKNLTTAMLEPQHSCRY